MKFILLIILTSFTSITISGFNSSTVKPFEYQTNYEIPENIQNIFDQSCTMCHSKESKNAKGKLKLKLDQLDIYSKSKMISKLSKIAKEVNKEDMPPKKFTAKNPEKALSKEDKNALISWAKNYATELSK